MYYRKSINNILKYIVLFIIFVLYLSCDRQINTIYHAVVFSDYSGKAGDLVNRIPTFSTLKEVLNYIPEQNNSPFIIFIHKGRYYEKLIIDKSNVVLIGESRDETIITFDATGDTPNPSGGTYGTRDCATIIVNAPDFRAENLTIENGFDYPANVAKSDDDSTKIKNTQAVALMTSSNCDRAVFSNCNLVGFQDTVFPDAGRHYFYKCRIEGHVDFIFGAGQAVFENCEIVSRNRKNKKTTGYVTAPSTTIDYPFGFLFVDCRLIKENAEVPTGSVCLGRPWHPNADSSISGSSVFISCFMDDHIGPKGYAPISSRDSTGERIWFNLEPDSRFFEFKSFGPGALNSPTRPILDEKAASWYKTSSVLESWNPKSIYETE